MGTLAKEWVQKEGNGVSESGTCGGENLCAVFEKKELFDVLRLNVRKLSLQGGFVIKRITEIIDFQDEFTRKTKFYNLIEAPGRL